jgi:hypothetical protein
MEAWRSGSALQPAGGAAWTYRGMEVWKHGGTLQVQGRGGMGVWSFGGLEACCRYGDIGGLEAWRPGGLEVPCRCRDVEVCMKVCGTGGTLGERHRGMDVWSSGAMVQVWRYWRSGGLEAHCRPGHVEVLME